MRPIFPLPTRVCFLTLLGALAFAGCEAPQVRTGATSNATLVSDTTRSSGGKTRPAQETGGVPEGVARVGDRFYYVHDGEATRLTQRQRFASGLSYEGGTRVVAGDGRLIRLSDREMITFSGERLPLPPGTALP